MKIPFIAILKVVDLTLAGLQVADKTIDKVKRWQKRRKAEKDRKARLIREINKS